MIMDSSRIVIDWNRLLGFDQAGAGAIAAPLQAKVGNKPPTGALGRPQELLVITGRAAT